MAPVERALGVLWAIESDTFRFRIVLKDQPLTRRGILATESSIYDPLGFVAPVVLVGKQILQQMCVEHAHWDDPVSEDLRPLWEQWRSNLRHLDSLDVNRCCKPLGFGKVSLAELHYFSDASTRGYAQCCYLRIIDEQKNVHCSLVMGKSRVAPLKAVTIPRLELTAALISVKVSGLMHEELFGASEYLHQLREAFWTDSKIVLGYISYGARRFHIFVANRVQQIRDHTSSSQWKYVKTGENPADDGSRGITAEQLVHHSKWISGPDFQWDADYKFCPDKDNSFQISTVDPEVRSAVVCAVAVGSVDQNFGLEWIKRFSSWYKASRAIANCLLIKNRLLERVRNKASHFTRSVATKQPEHHKVTVDLLVAAETDILRMVQKEMFQAEIKVLLSQCVSQTTPDREIAATRNQSMRVSSTLYCLDPFLDANGLIRVGGRLRRSGLSFNACHPVVLPRKHPVTELLIRHFHEKIEHQGRGMTTNEIRSNGFWVLGGSSAVSDLIHVSNVAKCDQGRDSQLCRSDGGSEDVEFGSCMEKLGVKAGYSLDSLKRSRFHCLTPEAHFFGKYPAWYYKYDANDARKGVDSVSDYAITFHFISPERMYHLEFYVYHLRPYGVVDMPQSLNNESNQTQKTNETKV